MFVTLFWCNTVVALFYMDIENGSEIFFMECSSDIFVDCGIVALFCGIR